ncbi:MAG: ATPase, T2SS/T4P/T4SS family, partial [Betaproteobacteria bacterium]
MSSPASSPVPAKPVVAVPVLVPVRRNRTERRITVPELMAGLLEDVLISPEDHDRVLKHWRTSGSDAHPLVVLAEAKMKSLKPPCRAIDIEKLTEWAAGRVEMPYYHIDPLKIDMRAVTEVMSSDYASKRNILPVEARGRDVVIATCEPYLSAWQRELGDMLKYNIQVVLSNPLDISRYVGEFYNLSRSVKRAEKSDSGLPKVNDFEQLVELGKAGRTLDANDHHIVTLVDWLWQYAFDQRASDIHLEPRRDSATVRFRIDGVLHQVYQVPATVANAMTSRIKILGRMDVVEKRRPQDGRIKTR